MARLSVAAAVVTTLVVGSVGSASSAAAAAPVTWPDADALPLLQALLLFVGVPLAIVLTISLLAAAPAIARGSRDRRDGASWSKPLWFGGSEPELGSGSAETDAPGRRMGDRTSGGGAGARW